MHDRESDAQDMVCKRERRSHFWERESKLHPVARANADFHTKCYSIARYKTFTMGNHKRHVYDRTFAGTVRTDYHAKHGDKGETDDARPINLRTSPATHVRRTIAAGTKRQESLFFSNAFTEQEGIGKENEKDPMQLISLSPLQLRHHCFTHVFIHANPGGTPNGQISLDPVISFEKNAQNQNQWNLALEIATKSSDAQKPFLYEVNIAIQGVVEVQENFQADNRDRLAVVNGLSILYSAIREMLLTTTARSGPGLMGLPTLNFIEIVGSMKEAEKLDPKAQVEVQPTGNTTGVSPSQT